MGTVRDAGGDDADGAVSGNGASGVADHAVGADPSMVVFALPLLRRLRFHTPYQADELRMQASVGYFPLQQ